MSRFSRHIGTLGGLFFVFYATQSCQCEPKESKQTIEAPASLDVPEADSSPKTKIVCLGDSITEGLGVSHEEAFPALLEQQLSQKGHSVAVVNAGFSGSTSASGPSRLKWQLRNSPDILILELGANDALRGQDIAQTKENLRQTIAIAKDAGIKIVLTEINLPPNYGVKYSEEFKGMFTDLAEKEKVRLLPFLDEFSGKSALIQEDGLHPNAAGHQFIANELAKVVGELMP